MGSKLFFFHVNLYISFDIISSAVLSAETFYGYTAQKACADLCAVLPLCFPR
jgi:hypothetical protein